MIIINRTVCLYLYTIGALAFSFWLSNMAHSQNAFNQRPDTQLPYTSADRLIFTPLQFPQESQQQPLINYYASGDAFYLDMDSFKPTTDGKIYYTMTGKNLNLSNGEDRPILRSSNVVDCNRGTFISQLSREQFDASGNVISKDTFDTAQPKTLSPNGSKLYVLLKDACKASFETPEKPIQWPL